MKEKELLAPAGSIEALEAAVESGADAVYIGGSKFNARAYAENLDRDIIQQAVEYAHVRGVKVYVTVNILILQQEIPEVIEYIGFLYTSQVDAVIVQDIGLAELVRRFYPDFEVHCSTQMAIHNTDGARLLKKLGCSRVVLARELTLEEVDEITMDAEIETEIFVHGALCVCYSGQCYMSSLIGGRSGNRGKCAQPCRRKYQLFDQKQGKAIGGSQGAHLISTRDLNTYERLQEIAASKATSLKIEGRMKRPEYVATIVHHYREALDNMGKPQDPNASYELRIAFNREFTQGYLFHNRNENIVSRQRPDNRGVYLGSVLNQKGNFLELAIEEGFLNDGDGLEIIGSNGKTTGCMVSGIKKDNVTVKTAKAGERIKIFLPERVEAGSIVNKTLDSQLFRRAREEYADKNRRKIPLSGSFLGRVGDFPLLSAADMEGHQVTVKSEEKVEPAQKQGLSEDKIKEQINKTKDTPYFFDKLDVYIEPNSFLSVKTINNLRRDALDKLSDLRIHRYKRAEHPVLFDEPTELVPKTAAKEYQLVAAVRDAKNGIQALKAGADCLYFMGDYRYQQGTKQLDELAEACEDKSADLFYMLPQITRNEDVRTAEVLLKAAMLRWPQMGLVISNLAHIELANRLAISKVRSNFTLNIINSFGASFLQKNNVHSLCVSPELNISQIKDLREGTDISLEAVVYGYLPAMITEHCPTSEITGCTKCVEGCGAEYAIVDERNKRFKLIQMGKGKNIILNSDILCVYDHLATIAESGIASFRLDFYDEGEEAVFDITKAYKQKLSNLRSNTSCTAIEQMKQKGYTKGHYFRGIE